MDQVRSRQFGSVQRGYNEDDTATIMFIANSEV